MMEKQWKESKKLGESEGQIPRGALFALALMAVWSGSDKKKGDE